MLALSCEVIDLSKERRYQSVYSDSQRAVSPQEENSFVVSDRNSLMTKTLKIVPDKCTGCMQCELACSWVQTGFFQPSRSVIRVNVFDEEASYAPFTCFQCQEA